MINTSHSATGTQSALNIVFSLPYVTCDGTSHYYTEEEKIDQYRVQSVECNNSLTNNSLVTSVKSWRRGYNLRFIGMQWTLLVMMISLVSSFRFQRKCMRPFYRNDVSILHFSKHALSESNLWRVICKSEEEIEEFGWKMSSMAGNSDVILLKGDLGAGKTTFTRGLIRAKFEDDSMRVTSPSYLLDNAYEYDEGKYIHHMDLYRLPTGCDLSILGIPEIYSTSLCIIEWPQRMGSNLPEEYLEILISIEKDESRIIQLVAVGDSWVQKMRILFDDMS